MLGIGAAGFLSWAEAALCEAALAVALHRGRFSGSFTYDLSPLQEY